MKNKLNLRILFIGLLFATFFATPQVAKAGGGEGEEFVAKDMIVEHIMDEYEWHIATTENSHITIPLPIIIWADGQLDVFMSSEFHHAEENDGWVKRPTGEYKIAHGEQVVDENLSTLEKFFGYKAVSQAGLMERNGGEFIDFSFTKNVAFMALGVIILMLIFLPVASAMKKNKGKAPKGLQNLIEPLFTFIRDDVAIPNIGEAKYRKFMPFIMTIFFFVWIVNLLGLLPTGANASGNIAFTLTIAVFTLIVTNVSANAAYWKHILWTPGVPLPLRVIMLPVELLGIITKPFALMIRLFANITAGHIIILSLISFIFIFKNAALGAAVGPVIIAMTFLELFVAALQAYIFALLSALFIGLAVEEHEHEEAH